MVAYKKFYTQSDMNNQLHLPKKYYTITFHKD